MTISELIARLQGLKQLHGDIEVLVESEERGAEAPATVECTDDEDRTVGIMICNSEAFRYYA